MSIIKRPCPPPLLPPLQRTRLHPLRSKVIAVDVDGTLHNGGQLNTRVVAYCERQRAAGKTLILWSARGTEYAQRAADRFGVADLFEHIIGKPEAIVDDKGWSWIRFSRVVRSLDEDGSDSSTEEQA